MAHGSPSESWSDDVAAMWGKTGQDDSWLPLWRHLEDSAAVAGLVWDRWLPRSVKDHVTGCLPGADGDGRKLLIWLAGIHDIGKATPAFAIKAPSMTDRLHRRGFDLDVPLAETPKAPHGALGYVILRDWLHRRFPGAPRSAARAGMAMAVIVGGHHGLLPDEFALQHLGDRRDFYGGPRWKLARDEILDRMAAHTGALERLPEWLTAPLPATAQASLAAAVVVADWLASDETRFPYVDRSPGLPTWETLRLPSPWTATPPPREPATHLAERFPALTGLSPTPIQESAIEAAWSADRPPLVVLEAEMGSGKTEAGLAAAEVLAHRFGQGGVFLALPTMATSDAMFGRVRSWIDELPGGGSLSMFLAHGKAGLNDEYRGLDDDQAFAGIYDDDNGHDPYPAQDRAVATVNAWTRGRRKGVLAPFVVGTIDQVLFAALRSKHLALRHLAIAGKVVVIDEVHAADTYMREYLTAALTWLGAYDTPVVLMSATLPSAQRAQLVSAYAAGAGRSNGRWPRPPKRPTSIESTDYPRTTLLDSTLRGIDTPQHAARPRSIEFVELGDELDELIDVLRTELAKGGCVAVVRNTVTRAQATWAALRKALPDAEVVLVHSRFLAVERARREADLRARLGRGSSLAAGTRPQRLVVVGTQVLEQSLDIDVDLMISDLAPMDLLLQRAGRLHRHDRGVGESDRPSRLRQPRLLLTGADWDSVPVKAAPGSRRVYGASLLMRAAATLRAHGSQVRLPRDIPRLVAAAYDPATAPPAEWELSWAIAEKQAAEKAETAHTRAKTFRLDGPSEHEGLLVRSGFFRKGDPDDGNGGRSQVRDGEDSLEVVVVRRVGEQLLPMAAAGLPEGTVLYSQYPPDARVARALAGCTVRLPSWSTASDLDAAIAALEDMSFEGWQQDCPWLAGQLTLVLDEHGRARIADLELTYDSDSGLLVSTTRRGSNGDSADGRAKGRRRC